MSVDSRSDPGNALSTDGDQWLHFSQSKMEGFIVGGKSTDIRKFPHSVFLNVNCIDKEWICGSSAVNQAVLLTAAHCLDDCKKMPSDKITALAGHEDLEKWVHFSQSKMEGFIVGGDSTNIRKFPHSVFLNIECPPSGWICGSSVVTQAILLTAAHCLEKCVGSSAQSIAALAGHEDLEKVTVQRRAQRFAIHEKYDTNQVINDLALVFLKTNLPLGQDIKRIILKKFYSGKYAKVAGWGVLDVAANKETEHLMYVKQRLNSKKNCRQLGNLGPGQLCAAGLSKTHLERPAEGDSGSALVTDDYQQIGLVSFRDAQFPTLVVYTNVSYYYDWIRRKSANLYCKG